MFSKEAIALARATVEAIKKITERQGKECPECKGEGIEELAPVYPDKCFDDPCPVCKGKGIVKGKWEWKPEVGEWVLWKNKPYVIYEVEENLGVDIGYKDIRIAAPYDFHYVMRKNLIPLLHWERIGKILRSLNHTLVVNVGFHFIRAEKPFAIPQDIWDDASKYKNSRVIYSCDIYAAAEGPKSRFVLFAFGKDYQTSVMLAVNKLVQESNHVKS